MCDEISLGPQTGNKSLEDYLFFQLRNILHTHNVWVGFSDDPPKSRKQSPLIELALLLASCIGGKGLARGAADQNLRMIYWEKIAISNRKASRHLLQQTGTHCSSRTDIGILGGCLHRHRRESLPSISRESARRRHRKRRTSTAGDRLPSRGRGPQCDLRFSPRIKTVPSILLKSATLLALHPHTVSTFHPSLSQGPANPLVALSVCLNFVRPEFSSRGRQS